MEFIWGMLASFTYAVMTLSNRYFASRYKGRTICLYEQGTAAIALLPALGLVKAEWRPVDFAGVATIGFLCTAIAYSLYVTAQKGCESADCGNHFRYGDGIRDRICTDLLKRNPYGQRTGRRCSDTWNRILFVLA